jgi:hypothetical protein
MDSREPDARGDEPLIEGVEQVPRASFDPPPVSAPFRDALLARTSRVVCARRSTRRLFAAACAALLFGLGVAAGWRLPREAGVPGSAVREPQAAPPVRPQESRTPADLLREVPRARPEERPKLLRQAGDSYLASGLDLERALHCYRQYLEVAPAASRSDLDPRDSWLLSAMKRGRATPFRR